MRPLQAPHPAPPQPTPLVIAVKQQCKIFIIFHSTSSYLCHRPLSPPAASWGWVTRLTHPDPPPRQNADISNSFSSLQVGQLSHPPPPKRPLRTREGRVSQRALASVLYILL